MLTTTNKAQSDLYFPSLILLPLLLLQGLDLLACCSSEPPQPISAEVKAVGDRVPVPTVVWSAMVLDCAGVCPSRWIALLYAPLVGKPWRGGLVATCWACSVSLHGAEGGWMDGSVDWSMCFLH